MTLDEFIELKELAAARERHLELAKRVETQPVHASALFGIHMTKDLEDVIRTGMAAEYRRRAGIVEARLRELGVLFPGDILPLPRGALPEVDPGAEHASFRPNSWDRREGTFDVWVPSTPTQSWRDFVPVDEILRPQGLAWDTRVEVVDATDPNGEWRQCGTVIGSSATNEGVTIRVRLNRDNRLVWGAVANGRVRAVGIGYDFLEQETVRRPGDRLLVTVLRWRLREIRLHRADALAEAD